MTDIEHMSAHDAAEDPRNAKLLIHVNGRLVPRAEAPVSVYDSGFMLGDGVWEGLRLHHGRWAFRDAHLDRLFEAARAIDLDIGRTREDLAAALDEIAEANGMTDDAHARLMLDLLLLAFQSDATRVASMILAREVSNRPYPQIGVPEQHHPVSHHRNDPGLIEKKSKIDTYHVSLLAYLAEKMAAVPDGDGSLLDNSLLLYGGGMGDGNLHRHADLPCALVGLLGGRIRSGQHVACASGTPMTNMLLTLLDKVDVQVDAIGDSTGPLAPDMISAV